MTTPTRAFRYFGLDGEMSGADLDSGGRLIQIGVAANTGLDFNELDGPESFSLLIDPGPMEWEPVAEAVHGFDRSTVEADGITPEDADARLVAWLVDHGASPQRRGLNIPVGFNVGAFDMPHVARILPRTYALFSRRTLDLNPLLFTLAGEVYDSKPRTPDDWKALSIDYAARKIAALTGAAGAAHDAGNDALIHLHAWRFLRAAVRGNPFSMDLPPVEPPQSQVWAQTVVAQLGPWKASTVIDVPQVFIEQWARGGRATNIAYLTELENLVKKLEARPAS